MRMQMVLHLGLHSRILAKYPQHYPTLERIMSSEPITLSNINLAGALDPSQGYFTSEMLRAAVGLADTNAVGVGVRVAAIPVADFKQDNDPIGWLWKPSTVQSLMTSTASATVRAAVAAAPR